MNTPFTPKELENPAQAARTRATSRPAYFNAENPEPNSAHPDNSLQYNAGKWLRGLATSGPGQAAGWLAAQPFNHGPILGAGAGALGGTALGYGLGRAWNAVSDDGEDNEDRPQWTALIGALAGGLGGKILGDIRQKSASMLGGDRSYIQSRLAGDYSITRQEKQSLLATLTQVDEADLAELASLLRTSIGAGAGMLIAKFLMQAGVGGMLIGALTGGFIGNRLSGPSILGTERHSDKTDAYGNPYTF
jgi:hypothetical protein